MKEMRRSATFNQKAKDKVSKNSLLEAYLKKVGKDPEILNMIREQILKDNPEDSPNPFEVAYPEEDNGDLEMLFLKMCEEQHLLPIVSVLTKLTSHEKGIVLDI